MRRFLALAFGCTLTACSLAPDYVQPELPVPAGFPASGTQSDAYAVDQDEPAWEDFFTDRRLRDLIELALDNNRDLRLAVANIERARALYRVQRADRLPTIDVGISATRQDMPLGTAGNGGTSSSEAQSGRIDIYAVDVGISSWEVDLFGRVRNLGESARQQYFAIAANRDAAQAALVAELATVWLTMAADQDRLRIAQGMKEAFGETLELTRARYDKGVASELEVHQARTSFDRARSDMVEIKTLIAQSRNALDLLVGTVAKTDLLPDGLEAKGATLAGLPSGLPSRILLRRPDISAAEHQLRAADADIGVARAAFFPRISLTAAYGTISSDLSGLFDKDSDFWSVAPAASLPIFDFGRTRANLRYAAATRDAMLARYEQAIQQGFREVADALARRATIEEQLEAQTSLRGAAADACRLAEQRYRRGIDPYLVTLDSQRTLYAAEQSLLAARLVRETNAVELFRALGGGSKRNDVAKR